MSGQTPQFAVFPGGKAAHSSTRAGREFQELWFSLAQRRWSSLVLVPIGAGASAAMIATRLAEVGSALRDTPVTAIVAESIDYGSVRVLTDLQVRVQEHRTWGPTVDVEATVVTPHERVASDPPVVPVRDARPLPPSGQVIVAIQSVERDPLGVAIAQAADATVLCIEMGASRGKAIRRTIELIGADRVLGAVLIR
jgi:hypothetical protein